MKVEFIYSLEKEISRLTDLASEYQWFLDNNFPIILPDFYDEVYQATKGRSSLLCSEIAGELAKIYNESQYRMVANQVKDIWRGIESNFFVVLSKLDLDVQDSYQCHVSLYGPEGQFFYPNIIILRMATPKDIEETNITLAHEIIHLAIYKKAKQFSLNYQQIEGIVDLIFTETGLKSLFPHYKLQEGVVHDKNLLSKFFPG